MLQRLRFTTKLTTGFLLLGVIPLAIIGYWLSLMNESSLKETSRELYLSIAHTIASRLEHQSVEIERLLARTDVLLNSPLLDEKTAIQLISDGLTELPSVSAIGIYDASGYYIDFIAKQGRPGLLPYSLPSPLLRRAQNSKLFIGAPLVVKEGGPMIPIVLRCNGGRFNGLLMAVIENSSLTKLVRQVAATTFAQARGRVYIVDDSLRLIVQSDTRTPYRYESLAGKGIFKNDTILSTGSAFNVSGSVEYPDANAVPMHGTYTTVASFGLGIVVEQPQSVAYKAAIESREKLLYLTILSGVLAMILGFVLARQIAKPITQLVRASEKLARQDFSERLPDNRWDEFAVLFKAYNHSAEEMQRIQHLNINEIITERNKFEAVARQASDGIIIISPTQTILLINDVFAGWFSCRPEDVEGKPVSFVLQQEEILSGISAAFTSEDHVIPVESHLQKVGEVREVVLRGAFAKVIVEHTVVALAGILRDVSKEVEIDELKTNLVSIVAHELRSPLNGIKGYSDMISMKMVDAEQAVEFAGIISGQADRLNKVITKFLDINRMEAGKTDIQQMPFKVHDLLQSIISINMPLAQKKGIAVQTHIPSTSAPIVGDPDLIGQVILNFFSNAVKYSEPNTTIKVQMIERMEEIYVAVEDQGYGISESAKHNLFTKFFRATEDTRVQQHEGTGLGLAFVKEIIDKHQGEIGVESTLNVGSTFWFTLPK